MPAGSADVEKRRDRVTLDSPTASWKIHLPSIYRLHSIPPVLLCRLERGERHTMDWTRPMLLDGCHMCCCGVALQEGIRHDSAGRNKT